MIEIAPVASVLPAEPYRGLDSYRFCDRAIFFERETDAERLLRLVTMYRGSLLYGESGAGKSSLINAGLLPRALAAGYSVERLRVQPRHGHEFVVERISCSDVENDVLPSVLINSGVEQRTAFAPAEFLQVVRRAACATDLLLIFDQFEELLTLVAEDASIAGAQECQRQILEVIVALVQDRSLDRLRLLFVFREDYLAKFDKLFYFCPELTDRFMRLTPPVASALPHLLRGPFDTEEIPKAHWKHTIPDTVMSRLEQQLRPAEEGRALKLAQVQVAALQLWRGADPESMLARGGVDGLVRDFLKEQLDSFKEHRATAEALLALMITRQGTRKVVAESEAVDELARHEGTPEPLALDLLERLVGRTRLVRRDFNRGTTTYEIVSEFLVPWILMLKVQRAAIRARNAWLKRAAVAFAVVAAMSVAAYYWKYTGLTRDQLVQYARAEAETSREAAERAKRDQEAERQNVQRLGTEVRRLQAALQLQGNDRERKLAEELELKSREADELTLRLHNTQEQLAVASRSVTAEKEARTEEQVQANATARGLQTQVTGLNDRIRDLEARLQRTGDGAAGTSTRPPASKPFIVNNGTVFLRFNDLVTLPRNVPGRSGLLLQDAAVFVAKEELGNHLTIWGVVLVSQDPSSAKTHNATRVLLRKYAPFMLGRVEVPGELENGVRAAGWTPFWQRGSLDRLVKPQTLPMVFQSGSEPFSLEVSFDVSPPIGMLVGLTSPLIR